MYQTKIAAVGRYLPERNVTNKELSALIDTSHDWIVERTGIHQRRWFKPGVDTTSNMGAKAAQQAIDRAGISRNEVDFIVFATLSPDYVFPGSGVLVQKHLELDTIGALDIRNQCSGFIYGLSVADQYIKTGKYKNVLLICSEIQSNIFDLSDKGRSMAVIFGDGAAAFLLQRSDNTAKILTTHMHSEGRFAEELFLKEPSGLEEKRIMPDLLERDGIYPYMNGRHVFKHAVTRMTESVSAALEECNKAPEDIDIMIPHQANLRIAEAVRSKLNVEARHVFNNIQDYGNTTAASIPIAFFEALEQEKVKRGDLICFTAFGSGFTWGTALLEY